MDLYKISFLGTIYTYSSGIDTVQYGGFTYKASPITRTELELELTASDVRLTIPLATPPFTKFVVSSPSSDLTLTLIDYSTGYEIFNGVMTKVTFDRTAGTLEAIFQRKEAFFDSEVPYRTYGTSCSFGLYSEECGVDPSLHSFSTTLFSISANRREVQSAALAGYTAGTMSGGYLRTNEGETCFILKHDNTGLYLDQPLLGTPTGIYVRKGCNKLFTTCKNKFANELNFGGFPFTPTKNPVTESI